MASGAPVLTTKLLAIPEIGGDAVAYTGTDADSIAADLRALLADPGRRAELAAAGWPGRRSSTGAPAPAPTWRPTRRRRCRR